MENFSGNNDEEKECLLNSLSKTIEFEISSKHEFERIVAQMDEMKKRFPEISIIEKYPYEYDSQDEYDLDDNNLDEAEMIIRKAKKQQQQAKKPQGNAWLLGKPKI